MYSRENLIEICERSVVLQENWRDRDTYHSQTKLGQAWALLKAGCDFKVRTESNSSGGCISDGRTIWIDISAKGFASFDWGGDLERETYYLPTPERLSRSQGKDWY